MIILISPEGELLPLDRPSYIALKQAKRLATRPLKELPVRVSLDAMPNGYTPVDGGAQGAV